MHEEHFSGTAPSGRYEDSTRWPWSSRRLPADAAPRVVEVDGTTDTVAWVPVHEVNDGSRHVLDVVHKNPLEAVRGRP